MIKIALIVIAALVLLVALTTIIGFLLPQCHVLTRFIVLKQKRDAVYALISDLPGASQWRSGISSVEAVKGEGGETLYKETSRQGVLHYRIVETMPPQKFVTAIAEKNAPFGGTWTIELAETPEGTRVSVTERGEVYNPLFRFLSKFVFGHHATVEAYLKDLAAKFGETAPIQTP